MTWQTRPEKGNSFVWRLTLGLYRVLGRRLLKWLIVPVVIFWYWLLNPSIRAHSQQYLERVTPYLQAASHPKPLSSYQHFKHYGLSLVDKLAAWLGDVNEQHLVLNGHEHFREHYGKGAIILTSHFGNIELLRAIKTNHPQMVNVLVYTKHAQQFNQMLQRINPAALVRLISVDDLGMDTAILLKERLDAGEWLMISADRTPVHSERTEIIPFLGHDSHWPQGAWLLASLLKCPVLALFCYPHEHQHHVCIHLMSQGLDAPRSKRQAQMRSVMVQYTQLFEHYCSLAPYQWFNFYPFWNNQNTSSNLPKD